MSEAKGITKSAHPGKGYLPLVDFESWRVAILRDDPTLTPETITFLERHNLSDEVFVLLEGSCLLIWTDQEEVRADQLKAELLKPGTAYNVAKGTWHSSALLEGTQVLIVENANTDDDNSQLFDLTEEQRRALIDLARLNNYPEEGGDRSDWLPTN